MANGGPRAGVRSFRVQSCLAPSPVSQGTLAIHFLQLQRGSDKFPFSEIGQSPEMKTVSKPNPQALLRYYRSALRADPRGALTQSPDRHGSAFQLVAGTGRWWGGEESLGEMRLQLDQLPSGFREALSKREANENTLAVGWPLAVGRKSGAPAIRPVGLLAAEWQRKDGALTVTIETDDVLVNPDWIKAAARSTSWTEAGLNQIFLTSGGAGLPRDDFLERLQEAMAKSVRGSLQGVQLASMLEPEAEGIHDAAGSIPADRQFFHCWCGPRSRSDCDVAAGTAVPDRPCSVS